MKHKYIFFVKALIACLLTVTFLSCSSRDVERGFVGNIRKVDTTMISTVSTMTNQIHKKKEHRVYYFDNSGSMINNNLFNPLKENLLTAIDNFPIDLMVEIIVFSDAKFWVNNGNNDYEPDNRLHIKKIICNDDDKKELKDFVSKIDTPKQRIYYTHHYIVINDFLKRRIVEGYDNVMYLLTDGVEHSVNGLNSQDNILKTSRWNTRDDVYGIYVDLKAAGHRLGNYFNNNQDKHLYRVHGCNIGINLFRVNPSEIAIDNALNTSELSINLFGDSPDKITLYSDDDYYKCTLKPFSCGDEKIVLNVEPINRNCLPQTHDVKIRLDLTWKENGMINIPSDFVNIVVKCHVPQNGVMSIATPIQMGNAKIKFRKDKVFWNENNPDTLNYKINYKFSENLTNRLTALQSPYLSIDFGDANDYIELLDTHGVLQSRIKLPIASDTTISFALTINKNHGNLQRRQTLHGKIALNNLTNVDALYLGKNPIEKCNGSYVIYDDFELEIKQRWELWKWCCLALLLLLVLIVIAIIIDFWKCYDNASKFPGDLGQSIVFTGTGLDAPMGFSMNFDGFLVESLAYNAIKTHKLSSTFVQKIIIHNGHYNEYKPTFWEKHTKGDIIYLRSNDFIDGIMEKIEIIPTGKNKEFVAQFKIFSTTNSIEEIQTINLALGQLNTVNSQVNSNERILNYNLTVMGSILIPPTATHSTYTN